MADIAELGLSVRSDGVVTATNRLNKFEKQSGQTERATDKLSKSVTRLAGVASAALVTAFSVQKIFAYQDALAEVSTLVDTTTFNMKGLSKSALEQGKAFGNVQGQVKAYYGIISAGASSAAEATGTLTAANKLAIGGVTDIATAADGLTSVLNAYGSKVDSATAVSDALFVAMRAGKTTIGELSSGLGKVAPLAAQTGVGFDELVGAVSALTKGGISTQESITGVRAVLASVAKPTSEAIELSNQLGIEFNSAGLAAKGFQGFIDDLVTKTGGSTDALAQLFGGVEALVPVMALSGQAGIDFANIMDDMAVKAGATELAFNKMAESPGFQSSRLWAGLQAEAIGLGSELATNLVPVIKLLADNVDLLIPALAGIGAALTVTLIPAIISATAATGAFTLALATNPVFLFATAIGVLTAAIVHYQNTQNAAEQATRDAVQAYEVNQKAIDNSISKTEGYTMALRNQIAMQVEAAKAAVTLADAEFEGALARRDSFRDMFGGMRFAPLEHATTQADMAAGRAGAAWADLATQLKTVDANLQSVETTSVKTFGGLSTATGGATKKVKEVADKLSDAEKEAQNLANTLERTLGSALSSLFDGPITDLDDALDGILGSFASLGQQNLSNFFNGMLSPTAANDNGSPINLLDPLAHAVQEGATKGTMEGSLKGLQSILGGNNGALSAGIGGLGIGYQTENPLMGALGGAASGFMAGGPVGAAIGGIAGLIGGIFGMAKAVREAQEKLESVRVEIDAFNAAANGETVSKYAQILDNATTKANEYIKLAEKAQDAATVLAVQQSLAMLPKTLGEEFTKELQASINSLRGNDYLNNVIAAQELYNSRLKDAELLGVDASLAFDELKLSLIGIAEESDLTQSQIDALRNSSILLGDALAGVVSSVDIDNLSRGVQWAEANVAEARAELVKSYEAEETAIKSTVEATRRYFDSLRQFRDDLLLDSNLSPLNPFERMQTAQSQFQQVAADAINGDQEALGKLEDVSRDYLNEARDYYGTSEAYYSVFGQVKGILDQSLNGLEAQLTEDQKQLAELQTQSSLLAGVNVSVMSVADAVANLAQATQLLASAQATYDTATGGGFSDQIKTLYQDVLGRAPDVTGAAYWQSRIDAGVTGDTLVKNFMSGVTGADTITASAIAKYGLPGYATGTMFHPGGLARINEQGGEIVNLPRGAQVIPHDVSMRVAGSNDNGASRELLTEVRALRAEVKALRETTAAGANMVASAATGTTGAVQRQTEEQKRTAGARRA